MRYYTRWIIIATVFILAAVLIAFLTVRSKQPKSTSSPTPSTSASTAATSVPSPTSTSTPEISPSPTPNATTPTSTTSHKSLGDTAYKAKDYDVAIAEYNAAIKEENASTELALLWNSLGNAKRESGDTTGAVTAYTSSVQYNPKYGDAYINKAALQWSVGKRDEATATLREGIEKEASRQQDLQNTLSVYESLPQ